MARIAMWQVIRKWGNVPVSQHPYNSKPAVDDDCYITLVKLDTHQMPGVATSIRTHRRVIRGYNAEKDRAWTKVFNDVFITTLVMDRFEDETKLTSHYHRGQHRVVGYDDVLPYLKMRWPDQWKEIYDLLH